MREANDQIFSSDNVNTVKSTKLNNATENSRVGVAAWAEMVSRRRQLLELSSASRS